jgi:WD40 repeat protein
VHAVVFSPEVPSARREGFGKTLATGWADKTVRLWDADSGAEKWVLKGRAARVRVRAFTPDSADLVSAALEPNVRTRSAADGKPGASPFRISLCLILLS